jgi:hypothetical protein
LVHRHRLQLARTLRHYRQYCHHYRRCRGRRLCRRGRYVVIISAVFVDVIVIFDTCANSVIIITSLSAIVVLVNFVFTFAALAAFVILVSVTFIIVSMALVISKAGVARFRVVICINAFNAVIGITIRPAFARTLPQASDKHSSRHQRHCT